MHTKLLWESLNERDHFGSSRHCRRDNIKVDLFCLFNGAVSISHCITSNDWMVVIYELGRIWKKVVVA